jgi:sortase A
MKLPNPQFIIEQISLLIASFVWTVVILAAVGIFWAYQDIQAREAFIKAQPPVALAQVLPTITPMPTDTPWAPPTFTPTPTVPPTPTATRVVPPPGLLPETFNADDPTPVIIQQDTPAPTVKAMAVARAMPTQAATLPPTVAPPTLIPPTATRLPAPAKPTATATQQIEVAAAVATPAPVELPLPAAAPVSDQTTPGLVPSRLVIPSVNIDQPIVTVGWEIVDQAGQQYSIWQVADNAVGWNKTSATLGQPGNTVLTGHHNVKGEVFRDLVNVEVGDKVTVYSGDQAFEYEIAMKTIVKEKGEPMEVRQRNAQWIAPTSDERLTMVTCWPYTNNTHRVIVVAKPVEKK